MMKITDLPASERPRERLMQQGAAALSDAELLAVFLRTGTQGSHVMDLARQLLTQFGSLNALLDAPSAMLLRTTGLGPAKIAALQAVRELSRRILVEPMRRGIPLRTPAACAELLTAELSALPYEVFAAVYLDSQLRYLDHEVLFRGTLSQTSVHPREVVRRALAVNAGALIVAHNHPSGVAEPSTADHHLTEQLRKALALIDVKLLDHFVIAGPLAYSFAEGRCL